MSHRTKVTYREIAKKYKVTPQFVHLAVKRKRHSPLAREILLDYAADTICTGERLLAESKAA